ncbi:MAG: ABC transporter substrate-binding protein [Methylobacteriaceae bacterium]|nr:ABC transporter substrate-binding protein [Methylobacteriaceae bacterium]
MFKALTPAAIAFALSLAASAGEAKELKSVGIIVGPLGNPFYVALAKGMETEVKRINPSAKVTAVSNDYDLNKDVTAVETFIASGTDIIFIDAADSEAIEPSVKKAMDAGITVVGVDAGAKGAPVNLTVDNTAAGRIACQYLAEKLGHKGNVVILDSVPMVALTERVGGCTSALQKDAGIKILSTDQRGDGSRDSGLKLMQTLLTRFPDIEGVFAINDQMAIGADLAAKQLNRKGLAIVGVDGSPEAEEALKTDTMFIGSAAQSPFNVGSQSVKAGYDLFEGKQPESKLILISPVLVNRDNIGDYKGWKAN